MNGTDDLAGPDTVLIEEVIATQVRPLLRVHGGDVTLLGVSGADVFLEFQGACRACALKTVTYAIGIRERLRHLPGVRNVTVHGIALSDAALGRVAAAYAAHPLLPDHRHVGREVSKAHVESLSHKSRPHSDAPGQDGPALAPPATS